MDEEQKKILSKTANAIRQLSFEAIQKANSGHPGLPMGCAELGAYLYGIVLKYNPKHPTWINRDRLILSAGHGSMWLFSCLHLAGFDISLEDIQSFRQLHSKTPGHPEYNIAHGIESTTGPLGQGVGNAIGQALGLKILATKFNTKEHTIFDAKVFCLAGDGCLMEGVSHEAASLAGHLCLDNFVLIHDANKVTLDGSLDQSSTENFAKHYEGLGFKTLEMNGNDLNEIDHVMCHIREEQTLPIYISCRTTIGKGSPHKEGTNKVHGAPLGEEEVKATKKALGLPEEKFYIPQAVKNFFKERQLKQEKMERRWRQTYENWYQNYPEKKKLLHMMKEKKIPDSLETTFQQLKLSNPISGRKASQAVLQILGNELPFLYGGSADLSCSDCTMMKQFPCIAQNEFNGRNIKFGTREFGMATIAAGLFQTEMILPYVGTFLTFSDYMRNAIRIAALSKYHIIYQLTHDSVFLGEDGPTHQPVEHLAAMRAIPNLQVIRPGDFNEIKQAWIAAFHYRGPTALVLSRQNLPILSETDRPYKEGVARGAYIIKREKNTPQFCLFASGSELTLALDVARALEKRDKNVRVVSVPCWELFDKQDDAYKDSILKGDLGKRVSIEAGVSLGWCKFIGRQGIAISIEEFGKSAQIGDISNEFGFTVDTILNRILCH